MRGDVWRRHCSALLRKHVFPVLTKPHPLTAPDGQDVSMGWSYNDFAPDSVAGGFSASLSELRRSSGVLRWNRNPLINTINRLDDIE
jgi:hypothetical protein